MKAKSILCTGITLALSFGTLTVNAQEISGTDAAQFKPVELLSCDENSDSYYEELYKAELYNYKVVRNIPTAYSADSWNAYMGVAGFTTMLDPENLDERGMGMLDNIKAAREALNQVRDKDDAMWILWENDMPIAADEESLVFESSHFDNADFVPYLVPYVLEDQSQVIGNLIVIPGGGYQTRSIDNEGFPICEAFNERGYNCFMLSRRVEPYAPEDSFLDLQRAVRYLRYYGEEKGLAHLDNICAAGFSGGSGTLIGAVENLYGEVQPTVYDDGYAADEIDLINSDIDTVISIYGPSVLETENPNMPSFFIAIGGDDMLFDMDRLIGMYDSVYGKAPSVDLHIFADNAHGFGVGTPLTTSTYWMELADSFMKNCYRNKFDDTVEIASVVEYGEIPAVYTKYQNYDTFAGFGMTNATMAMNDDESRFFLFFEAFGIQEVLAGYIEDGKTVVKYDRDGSFTVAAQFCYDGLNHDNWETR